MDELKGLVTNAKKQDAKSFEKLILDMKKDLYRIGKNRLNNEEDINDAVQETIITAYQSIKDLENPQSFKAWITKIFINNCNQICRKNNKYLRLSKKVERRIEMLELDKINIISIENKIEIERVLNRLSYNERWCIILFYNDYTINEISQILNINPNTVKSKLMRTREKIRNILD